MAKTFTAPFAQTPRTASAVATVVVASLTTDAPTNTIELFTAGSDGALVTKLTAIPRANVTATCLYLFKSNDGGTTKRLEKSVTMNAQTLSAIVGINSTDFGYDKDNPLRLGAGDKLYVGIAVALAGGIVFNAEVMDY